MGDFGSRISALTAPHPCAVDGVRHTPFLELSGARLVRCLCRRPGGRLTCHTCRISPVIDVLVCVFFVFFITFLPPRFFRGFIRVFRGKGSVFAAALLRLEPVH